MKKWLGLVLFTLLCMGNGVIAAAAYGYPVDTERIRTIAEQSDFPVYINEIKIVEDAFTVEKGSNDALVITVTNDSDMEIQALTVTYIFY